MTGYDAPLCRSHGEAHCGRCIDVRINSAVSLFHRHESEKAVLRPRLGRLADKLCMSEPYIIGSLQDAGLTAVLLEDPKTHPVTTDGIATGLSRALVALEARAKELALRDDLWFGETASCAKLVRGLLEALVDGPTDPGEKLAQR